MLELATSSNEVAVVRNEHRRRHATFISAIANALDAARQEARCAHLFELRAHLSLAIHRRRTFIIRLVTPLIERLGDLDQLRVAHECRDELHNVALPYLGLWSPARATADPVGYAKVADEVAERILTFANGESAALDSALRDIEGSIDSYELDG